MAVKPPLIIQKYGGATLSTPQKIVEIAGRIDQLKKKGVRVVVIVSAMGQTTNELLSLANKVSERPSRRELDMLLTTGERVSMSLMSMALQAKGCQAISFTGSQAGILTDDSHVNAQIFDVKAFRVEEAISQNRVVVLAGFQGVSPVTKEVTTLGRGGTDTTAVAMAIFLKADRVEILKDVPSVFTADPHLVAEAKPIKRLSYEAMLDMTFWGAKVMHYRSVELAARNQIPLYVGPANNLNQESIGTLIERDETMFEKPQFLAINSHERVLCISTKGVLQRNLVHDLETLLNQKEIAFPQILSIEKVGSDYEILVTGPHEILDAIKRDFAGQTKFSIAESELSTVTSTCNGASSPILSQQLLNHLAEAGLQPVKTLFNPMSLTILVERSERAQAVKVLHSLVTQGVDSH